MTSIMAQLTSDARSSIADFTQMVDSAMPTGSLPSSSPSQTSAVVLATRSSSNSQSSSPTSLPPSTRSPLSSITSLSSDLGGPQLLSATGSRNPDHMDAPSKSTVFSVPTSTRIHRTFFAATPSEITLLITDALAESGLTSTLKPTTLASWDNTLTQDTAHLSSSAPALAETDTPSSPTKSSQDTGKKHHTLVMILGCLLAFVCMSILALCLVLRRRSKETSLAMAIEKRSADAGYATKPVSPAKDQQNFKSFTDIDLDDQPPSPRSTEQKITSLSQEATTEKLNSRFSATSSECNGSPEQLGVRFSRQSRNLMNMFSSMVKRPASIEAPAPLLSPHEFFMLPMGGDGPHRRWNEISRHSGWSARMTATDKGEQERWSNSDCIV